MLHPMLPLTILSQYFRHLGVAVQIHIPQMDRIRHHFTLPLMAMEGSPHFEAHVHLVPED